MPIAIRNNFDYRAAYQSAWNQAVRGFTQLKNSCSQAYAKSLPTIAMIRNRCLNGLKTANAFAWAHKEWLAGGVAIAVALMVIHHVIKNIPQYPDVELESTLDTAALRIKVPKEEHVPVNVSLTFCVDLSGSMKPDERAGAVKRALSSVLRDAQKVVKGSPETKIAIALTGFNTNSHLITPLTTLKSTEDQILPILEVVKNLNFSGETNILGGLELAVGEVEKAAKANTLGTHTLILLTDGQDNITKLESLHNRLASVSAKLFAIGIGKEHNKTVLQKIASKGTYIDTTSDSHTIETAVAEIYAQAVSSFHSFRLTTAQLAPDTWSVLNTRSATEQGQLQYDLGSLSEEQTLVKVIKIQGKALKAPLDLSTVQFQLTFVDPKGKKGRMVLPWNPNTTINPKILTTAS